MWGTSHMAHDRVHLTCQCRSRSSHHPGHRWREEPLVSLGRIGGDIDDVHDMVVPDFVVEGARLWNGSGHGVQTERWPMEETRLARSFSSRGPCAFGRSTGSGVCCWAGPWRLTRSPALALLHSPVRRGALCPMGAGHARRRTLCAGRVDDAIGRLAGSQ